MESPFSREAAGRGSRAVKSSPEFVALRERVLELIWDSGGDADSG